MDTRPELLFIGRRLHPTLQPSALLHDSDLSQPVRCSLRVLHRDRFADLRSQQAIAQSNLETAQLQLHGDPMCPNRLAQVHALKEKYIHITTSALDLIRQQIKADWIGHGDDNTRFFHAFTRQRKTSTYIHDLQDDQGIRHSGFQNVSRVLQNFFSGLLGPSMTDRSYIDPEIIAHGTTLSVDLQFRMCTLFTDNDIKQAIFSIPNSKSPGPDGFSSGFFKATWDTTEPMVCNAIHHFFRTSELPPFMGHTKLLLIPKVLAPLMRRTFGLFPVAW